MSIPIFRSLELGAVISIMEVEDSNFASSNDSLEAGEMPKASASDDSAQRRCSVCAQPCMYHYYNVRSCEGCKQFFRRSVVLQRDFSCKRNGKCAVTKGEKCRSCRLDRCLLAGMEPRLIEAPDGAAERQPYLSRLAQRSQKAQQQTGGVEGELSNPPPQKRSPRRQQVSSLVPRISPPPLSESAQLLATMVDLERRQRRIWSSKTELPHSHLDRFSSLEQLVREPHNLLAKAHEFAQELPLPWRKSAFLAHVEQHGMAYEGVRKNIVLDRLLTVELAKSLPVFRQMDAQDQITHLRHISVAVGHFMNAFYSTLLGADTWVRADGMASICIWAETKRYRGDQRLLMLARRQFCDSVTALQRAQLDQEEFALMLGLLHSSYTAFGLSLTAKDLLYAESVRHAKALMQLLQTRYGEARGASKYAGCIHLVEQMFQMEGLFRTMVVYLEAFHMGERTANDSYPKVLCPVLTPIN